MKRTNPWELSDEVWERVRPLIPERPTHPKGGRPAQSDRQMLAGYDYEVVYETMRAHQYIPHIRPNLHNRTAHANPMPVPEAETSGGLEATKRPRRWMVERLHSWINRSRRLLVRWEKLDFTYQAFLHLACGLICFQHCDRLRSLQVSD